MSQRPTHEAPASGARWLLDREGDLEFSESGEGPLPPARYIGSILLPSERYELALVVQPDGAVTLEATSAPAALVRHALQFVRAATKGGARPRRIARWRASIT